MGAKTFDALCKAPNIDEGDAQLCVMIFGHGTLEGLGPTVSSSVVPPNARAKQMKNTYVSVSWPLIGW